MISDLKIKTKIILSLLALVIISLAISIAYYVGYHKQAEVVKRLKSNQEILLDKNANLKIDSINRVSEMEALNLSASEYKKASLRLATKVAELEISNKRLIEASTSSYKVITKVETKVKDSLVYVHDTVPILAKSFSYQDAYTNVDGYVTDEAAVLNIFTKDTITHVTAYEPKRYFFGLIKCGKKYIRSIFHNANPNALVIIQEAVVIEDKKRKF